MNDIITHIKCQRAKRPREQHIKLDTRKVDALVKHTEEQQFEIFRLEEQVRKLQKEVDDAKAKKGKAA